MGKDRDLDPSLKKKRKWTDPEVCKHFLVEFCPNELFHNTKSDLGPCDLEHDPVMKDEFSTASDREKRRYEQDFVNTLENLLRDVDSRIRRAVSLKAVALETDVQGPEYTLQLPRITQLIDKISALHKQIEALGEAGQMEESKELMKQADDLKKEKDDVERVCREKDARLLGTQEKTKVCEICGVNTSSNPDDSRAQSHNSGKQHIGFKLIRDTLEQLRARLSAPAAPATPAAAAAGVGAAEEARKDPRDRSGSPRRRSRSRGRSRDRRRRSRSRDRSSRRRRSRSRDRRSRSRGRRY